MTQKEFAIKYKYKLNDKKCYNCKYCFKAVDDYLVCLAPENVEKEAWYVISDYLCGRYEEKKGIYNG